MVEGLKLYEEFCADTEVSKLVALVNDLRSAGERGHFQSKFIKMICHIEWIKVADLFLRLNL